MYLISEQDKAKQRAAFVLALSLIKPADRNKISKILNPDNPIPTLKHIHKSWNALIVPCQGRCPNECSQGIDEATKKNCTECNGWGFVEAKL